MSRRGGSLIGYGIDEEIDPKIKFNSLLSVTVSTVMCLAAGCPLPKSNVETTKLFLSTITDDSGGTPKNIKCFLSLLDDYSGPYETEFCKERDFGEKLMPEKEEKVMPEKEQKPFLESMAVAKERSSCSEGLTLTKKNTKSNIKKNEKEQNRKISKHLAMKCSLSKSMISTKPNNRIDFLQ